MAGVPAVLDGRPTGCCNGRPRLGAPPLLEVDGSASAAADTVSGAARVGAAWEDAARCEWASCEWWEDAARCAGW